ncbi:MAG: hypothetical protein COB01_11365 [Lutibacter sp.]|nr:MAG: hypothetical protein COB01_11365 [Lutibacter sp.]
MKNYALKYNLAIAGFINSKLFKTTTTKQEDHKYVENNYLKLFQIKKQQLPLNYKMYFTHLKKGINYKFKYKAPSFR